jgi:hypothetical protein
MITSEYDPCLLNRQMYPQLLLPNPDKPERFATRYQDAKKIS